MYKKKVKNYDSIIKFVAFVKHGSGTRSIYRSFGAAGYFLTTIEKELCEVCKCFGNERLELNYQFKVAA